MAGRYRRGAAVAFMTAGVLAFCNAAAEETADTGSASADETSEVTPSDEAGGYTFPPEVEALLNQASDPEAYGELERCIRTRDIRSTQVLDEQHLVFRLSGDRYYLVQFPHRCHGLRRSATIAYETRTGQLCRLDQIRAFEPGIGIPNPPCSLPGFMPVEKEQVAMLGESLKARRKAELDAYKAEKAEKAKKKADSGEASES